VGYRLRIICLGLSLVAAIYGQPPLANPDFNEGAPGEAPPGWRFSAKPSGIYSTFIRSGGCLAGGQCAVLQSNGHVPAGATALLYQTFEVRSYRDRTFRFRAAVRTEVSGTANFASLWARVDREDSTMGFYDDMPNKPITVGEWKYYEISGEIAPDAVTATVGLSLNGSGAAWLDDVSFILTGSETTEPARPLAARELENLSALAPLFGYVRYFHPSDEAAGADWNRLAILAVRTVAPAGSPEDLAAKLRTVFAPIAPTVLIFPTGSKPPPPVMKSALHVVSWQHHGVGFLPSVEGYRSVRVVSPAPQAGDLVQPIYADLAGGVSCVVPIALYRESPNPAPEPPIAPAPGGTPNDRATRLAAVMIAWNVFEHFYPYFDMVRTDWKEALGPFLSEAAEDKDAHAFRSTLQKLTVLLQDGHGYLAGPGGSPRFVPPVIWTWADGQIVARAVFGGVDIRPGDALLSIDGRPATDVLREKETLTPGSTVQCLRYRRSVSY